jgi:hypothetical protein
MQNRNYYFNYQNNYFCFYRYLGNIDDIYSILNLNNYMIYNNFKINKIILNKDGSIITTKDGNNYILILLTINSKNKINLKNILDFSRKNININLLNRNNWILLWSNKIDNIEYTRIHLKNKYKLIYNSLPYYIGLTENAISYLRYNNIKNDNLGICHKRVDVNDSLIDFYNPINLVIDYRVRDLAEYFKSAFFSKIMDVTNIINYLKKIKMSNVDYIYFYVRMLYPSYYFDIYDKVLNGILKEEEILSITKLQNDYEYLLYEIYLVIKSHVNIVGIEWINKKFAI